MNIDTLFKSANMKGMELVIRSVYPTGKYYIHLYYVNDTGAKIRTVYEVYTIYLSKELFYIESLLGGGSK